MNRIKELREAANLSQGALAELAGTSQPQIWKLESGDRELTRAWAERLAPHLKVSAPELMFSGSAPEPAIAAPPPQGEGVYNPPVEFLGPRDLPVFAAVEGGPGEMVITTDPIEMVPRPWFLARVKDAYAVLVIGDSMEPVHEAGEMVLVNPRLPPLKGKDAIFVTGENEGEFRASIKRYLGATDDHWLAKQFNPPKGQKPELKLPKTRFGKALRVVGKYNG